MEEKRRPNKSLNNFFHFLQKSRLSAHVLMGFVCLISWELHTVLIDNYKTMRIEVIAAFFAQAAVQLGAIKFFFEHITKPIERDHD